MAETRMEAMAWTRAEHEATRVAVGHDVDPATCLLVDARVPRPEEETTDAEPKPRV